MMRGIDRREFLLILGNGAATVLAGCNTTQKRSTQKRNAPIMSSKNETKKGPRAKIEIIIEDDRIKLPPIWRNQSIDGITTNVTIRISDGEDIRNVELKSGNETIKQFTLRKNNSKKPITIEPKDISNTSAISLIAEDTEGKITTSEKEIKKSIPAVYRIDVKPEKNEELRNLPHGPELAISNETTKEIGQYIAQKTDLTVSEAKTYVSNPDAFSQEKAAKHIPMHVEREAVQMLKRKTEASDEEARAYFERPDEKNYFTKQTPLNSEDGLITNDPVFNYSSYEGLSFDKLPIDLAGMEYLHDNDTNQAYRSLLQVSDDDYSFTFRQPSIQAALLQEALDVNTDLETHVWSMWDGNIPFMVWNATESHFRIIDSVIARYGTTTPATKYSADTLKYQLSTYQKVRAPREGWHPVMFGLGEEEARRQGFGWTPDHWPDKETFLKKKNKVELMMAGMVSNGVFLSKGAEKPGLHDTAFTTGYLKSVARRFRENHKPEFDFQELLNQAKVLLRLDQRDSLTVVYGNVDNPKYAELPQANQYFDLHSEIEGDMTGKYDDFDSYLRNSEKYRRIEKRLEQWIESTEPVHRVMDHDTFVAAVDNLEDPDVLSRCCTGMWINIEEDTNGNRSDGEIIEAEITYRPGEDPDDSTIQYSKAYDESGYSKRRTKHYPDETVRKLLDE